MTTFTVVIVLATTALNVPATSPAEGVTLVEILDASGASIASQTTGYLFSGIAQGDYTMRASLLDVNGALIGTAYTQAFTAHEETRTVQVPSGATITVTPSA
ncbi:MAG: hypothetical protein JO253_03240 [Alphaproteobacteria bacterium]|nr:hypothetical protein [Alphaproteobacteria bacterium]